MWVQEHRLWVPFLDLPQGTHTCHSRLAPSFFLIRGTGMLKEGLVLSRLCPWCCPSLLRSGWGQGEGWKGPAMGMVPNSLDSAFGRRIPRFLGSPQKFLVPPFLGILFKLLCWHGESGRKALGCTGLDMSHKRTLCNVIVHCPDLFPLVELARPLSTLLLVVTYFICL